jgi:hypothetical protein
MSIDVSRNDDQVPELINGLAWLARLTEEV